MVAPHLVVFYSWQSDVRAAANRTLIEDALHGAAKDLAGDADVGIEVRVEQDTLGVPGSPNISATIFRKIEEAHVFVADVTLGLQTQSRGGVPNPNVLIELGYALSELGEQRVLLVMNTAVGKVEDLPFDLRGKRTLTYHSPEDAGDRAEARKGLRAALGRALRSIAAIAKEEPTKPPVSLVLGYKILQRHQGRTHVDRHDCELRTEVHNDSNSAIEDWYVELELPRALQQPSVTIGALVQKRCTATRLLYRMTHEAKGKLYAGDVQVMAIPYMMNDERRDLGESLMKQTIVARVYVDGTLAVETTRLVAEMQNF